MFKEQVIVLLWLIKMFALAKMFQTVQIIDLQILPLPIYSQDSPYKGTSVSSWGSQIWMWHNIIVIMLKIKL